MSSLDSCGALRKSMKSSGRRFCKVMLTLSCIAKNHLALSQLTRESRRIAQYMGDSAESTVVDLEAFGRKEDRAHDFLQKGLAVEEHA
jgi:hypothetical protein